MTVSEHSRLEGGGSARYRFTVEQNGGEHCKWVLCAPVAELGIQWVGMIRRQAGGTAADARRGRSVECNSELQKICDHVTGP